MASFLQIENLTKSYGDRVLFADVTFGVNEGDKIGLIAKNGMGKTTLLRCIAGTEGYDSGSVVFRNGLKTGFLEQIPNLDNDKSVLETCIADNGKITEAIDTYEHALSSNDARAITAASELMDAAQAWDYEDRLKQMLSQLGISDLTQPVGQLSGGQKKRVALAKIILESPQLIILDEPTNHLDLDMRQALTEALIEFEGALVVVSHDRHLLRSTTDDLYLVHDRKVEPFDGDLEDYQQWLSDVQKQENQTDEAPKENANSAQARKDQKRREAELRAQTQPLRKEIARLEKEMEKLNAQLAQAEEKLGDSELYDQNRKAELTACLQQQASAKSGLEECEMAWLEAQEQLEQMLLEGQSN